MMQRKFGRFGTFAVVALLAAFGLALAGGPALADADGAFKYRQNVMKALAAHMGAAAAIVKGQVDVKGQLAGHADAIAAIGKGTKDIFPKGSNVADSAALPAVWEKPDDFAKAVAAFEGASAKFASVAAGGDMQAAAAAFADVGKTCGGCHQAYRKKN